MNIVYKKLITLLTGGCLGNFGYSQNVCGHDELALTESVGLYTLLIIAEHPF